jgi:hypothetical protein
MHAMLENSETAILGRVFRPEAGDWPRGVAEAILTVGFNETDRERMGSLLDKAKAGELLPQEAEALENYRRVGRVLELMKSKARRSLKAVNDGARPGSVHRRLPQPTPERRKFDVAFLLQSRNRSASIS